MKPSEESHFRLHNKVTRKKLLFNKFIYNCKHDKLLLLFFSYCQVLFLFYLQLVVAQLLNTFARLCNYKKNFIVA